MKRQRKREKEGEERGEEKNIVANLTVAISNIKSRKDVKMKLFSYFNANF